MNKPYYREKSGAFIQFVWWGTWEGIGFWHYPKTDYGFKPVFYGLVLGFCEIRYFPKRPQ